MIIESDKLEKDILYRLETFLSDNDIKYIRE